MSGLTIGQVAERTGAATSALRYWEDLGLIGSVRTAGNQRRYERATIRRVSFIRAAQRSSSSPEACHTEAPPSTWDGGASCRAGSAQSVRSVGVAESGVGTPGPP